MADWKIGEAYIELTARKGEAAKTLAADANAAAKGVLSDSAAASIADKLKKPFKSWGDWLNGVLQNAANIAKGIGIGVAVAGVGVAAAYGAAQSPSLAVGAVSSPLSILEGFGSQLARFVEALSPARVEQFQFAIADTSAVLGRALDPILQVVIESMREVGAYFASGDFQNQVQSLAPAIEAIFGSLMEVFKSAISIVKPALELLAGAVIATANVLTPVITPLVQTFTILADSIGGIIKTVEPILLPVLASMGKVVSSLNDILGKFIAALLPLFDALAPILTIFTDAISIAADVVSGFAAAIGGVIDFVGSIISGVGDMLGAIGDGIADLGDGIADILGFGGEGEGPKEKLFEGLGGQIGEAIKQGASNPSIGASGKGLGERYDFAAFFDKLQASALQTGSGPEDETAKNTARAAELLQQIVDNGQFSGDGYQGDYGRPEAMLPQGRSTQDENRFQNSY